MEIAYIHFERDGDWNRSEVVKALNDYLKEEGINIQDVISITENLNEIIVYYKKYGD